MTASRLPAAMQLSACIALALAALPSYARPLLQVPEPEGEPWSDNVIAPEDLAPLPVDPEASFDPSGLPRSFQAELIASRTERGDDSFHEFGLRFGGFRESQDHGSFSLDATVLQSDRREDGQSDLGGTATLWQRGLFLDGGWRGNNGLGVLNTPAPSLLREQQRFFLPSVPFAGASTEWVRGREDLVLQGGLGRAGVFNGSRVVGFELADGNVGTVGVQWKPAAGWRAAISALATDGLIVPDDFGGSFFQDGRTEAVHGAVAWANAGNAVNLNLQASDGYLGSAAGAWMDVRHERGRFTHRYGVFNLQPDLAWGAQPISDDSRGAYYRIAYQHARWNWSAGLDRIASISGDSFDGWYGSGYARYQATASLGYGGNLALRSSDGQDAVSGLWFVDKTTQWGQSRLQLEHVHTRGSSNDDDSWELSFDQTLPLRQGRRLTLTTSYGQVAYEGEKASAVASVAAYGGLDLGSRVTLDGTARWTEGDTFRGADLNLNLAWRISGRWSLVATIYENQGSQRSPFIIDPLATEQPFVNLPRDRSFFLSLRYERQAGTSAGVLGGPPGGAAGSVTGSVFLDENGDGERSASELPAANVTVLLDGRYAVRTDSQGEFEFPRVAVGAHTVEVVPDNLPLPWFLDEDGGSRPVEVRVRDTTRIEIGARRQR